MIPCMTQYPIWYRMDTRYNDVCVGRGAAEGLSSVLGGKAGYLVGYSCAARISPRWERSWAKISQVLAKYFLN